MERYFAGWGVPIKFQSSADTVLSLGGTGDPSHVWVGLAQDNGKIWAVCDPTLGGIVKRFPDGQSPISRMRYWWPCATKTKSLHVSIQHPNSSLQAFGRCVPTVMLVDTENLIYYNTSYGASGRPLVGIGLPFAFAHPVLAQKRVAPFYVHECVFGHAPRLEFAFTTYGGSGKKVHRLYQIPINDY